MNLLESDLAFLEAMHRRPDWVEGRDQECIRGLLTPDGNETLETAPARVVLQTLLGRYGPMMQSPDKETRRHFEHLILRMQQTLDSNAVAMS